jgi:hypothetical protein
MTRKLLLRLPDGSSPVLDQVAAENEVQLQDEMKQHPELLPLEDLGLVGPPVVVGRESLLESGRIDLVLLGNGGDLALVEFKTGPQNPDFRSCLAQLLDYGSDLWGMSLEDFESRVTGPYFAGKHSPGNTGGQTLDGVVTAAWGGEPQDAVGWQERLAAQLRDGSFHYVAVAQRFTPSMLRTLRYLNATSKVARFSAVEMIRFQGSGLGAFEARVVAAAEPVSGMSAQAKTTLSGVDALVSGIAEDNYRHDLADLFAAIAEIDGVTVFWGTTGCSLRVPLPGRNPLSIGWVFPPGPPRWLGLTDVTLGWYQDSNGLNVSETRQVGLEHYRATVGNLHGATTPSPTSIHGWSFSPAHVMANQAALVEAIRSVATVLQAD